MGVSTQRGQKPVVEERVMIQKFTTFMGVFFVFLGLTGIVATDLMGMHLGLIHNIIHLSTGSLALWFSYSEKSQKAYYFSLIFGAYYSLVGFIGLWFGQPGDLLTHLDGPVRDQNALKVIPDYFELGTIDHVFHLGVGIVFLGACYLWNRRYQELI